MSSGVGWWGFAHLTWCGKGVVDLSPAVAGRAGDPGTAPHPCGATGLSTNSWSWSAMTSTSTILTVDARPRSRRQGRHHRILVLFSGWRHEMSVWPLREFSARPAAAPQGDAALARQNAPERPASWRPALLLAGIIVIGMVIGIVVGLSAAGLLAILLSSSAAQAAEPADGSILPFPPTPSASVAGSTLQESTHQRRVEPNRLPEGAPNILIILLDDVGFGLADTFGGEIHTPTLSRLAQDGVSYSAFHTTSICSPTRAVLLTGRNHHRAGSGTIAER